MIAMPEVGDMIKHDRVGLAIVINKRYTNQDIFDRAQWIYDIAWLEVKSKFNQAGSISENNLRHDIWRKLS
jgi:hypothetical protein